MEWEWKLTSRSLPFTETIAELEQDIANATLPGMKKDLQEVVDVLKQEELEARKKANQKKT